MAAQDERKKVLDMLAAGQINVDQASELLRALGDGPSGSASPPPPPPARTGTARLLRISIDANDDGDGDRAKIRVNVPLGLAKFAGRFLPAEARTELEAQGIDLSELINALSTETPEGKLVDIDVDDDAGGKKAKIVVEVV
ncbi:MAG: SHOCT-like domain-containing protein [Trueperaceae bacterium]